MRTHLAQLERVKDVLSSYIDPRFSLTLDSKEFNVPESITFILNEQKVDLRADGETSLLSVLRNDMGLTRTKYGCGEGQCGASTVLIDGKPRRACVTAVGDVSDATIRTIEGLSRGENLHPVQQAFLDEGAMQCAFCTTGMIMSSVGLLEKHRSPSRSQILRSMQGNVCRCGTYLRIIAAIERAAGKETVRG